MFDIIFGYHFFNILSKEGVKMMYIKNFEKKTSNKILVDTVKLTCGNECNVYTINDIFDLIQFIGFGKYLNQSTHNVFYRGQPDYYNWKMIPSLLRADCNPQRIVQAFRKKLNELLTIKEFENYPRDTFEAILQHYGMKTTQLDCVDNIWIALWFATHCVKAKIIDGHEYVYYYENPSEYSYVFLLACDAIVSDTNQIGIYKGSTTTVYDLRKNLPSYFIRPHAQHAYMIQKNKIANMADFSDLIIGVAKIPTNTALKWIGVSDILSVETLFPSPIHDSGFEMILNGFPKQLKNTVKHYGAIQIVHG